VEPMPDNVAAALAVLITAVATALLQYSSSHWTRRDRREDIEASEYGHEERRHHERRIRQEPYDGPDRRRTSHDKRHLDDEEEQS